MSPELTIKVKETMNKSALTSRASTTAMDSPVESESIKFTDPDF